MVLKDEYGRPLLNLRIAVTKRCDLNCSYCHGEGDQSPGEICHGEMMSEEIVRIVRVAAKLGISKVKLTGGEPLMRKDLVEIVRGIASTPGLTDLSMTSNGTLLASVAEELHSGGLNRVNISLPTLDADVYHKLTGGRVQNALAGVRAAVNAGLCPVKLNMLILKGANDASVPEMIRFAERTGAILQLIELEPMNMSSEFYSMYHKSLEAYEAVLKENAVKVESRPYMHNRRVYHLPSSRVEVVHPIENTEFCLHCTRLRVTSDGKLKPCLMRNDNLVDVLTPLRKGAGDEQLAELFRQANQKRQPYNKN
ncbi:MAG: GTP 3',8-cyclase MoaA [Candidatus Bathyarchaeia archaeon]|jgi:cyclic pyranopterin phosphate synthase